MQETTAGMGGEAGQSSDEDQLSSSCDLSGIRVEELSQTARHVTRQVPLNNLMTLAGSPIGHSVTNNDSEMLLLGRLHICCGMQQAHAARLREQN